MLCALSGTEHGIGKICDECAHPYLWHPGPIGGGKICMLCMTEYLHAALIAREFELQALASRMAIALGDTGCATPIAIDFDALSSMGDGAIDIVGDCH